MSDFLPKQIKCGAFRYAVSHVTRLCSDDHERLAGQARHTDKRIHIDEGMPFQQERETLLHEVLHAVECERNLDLSEQEISQLSCGLAQVLIDNPDLTNLFLIDPPD